MLSRGVGLGTAFLVLRDVLLPCGFLPGAAEGAKGATGLIFVRHLTFGSHCRVVYCLDEFEILGGEGEER